VGGDLLTAAASSWPRSAAELVGFYALASSLQLDGPSPYLSLRR